METVGQPVVEKRSVPRDQTTEGQQASRTVFERFKEARPSDKEIDGLAGTEGFKLRVRALFDEIDRQKPKLEKPVMPSFRGLHALQGTCS